MNRKPLVSIIIPTHNMAKFLQLSAGSVFKQTYKNFELIIVDDASEDNTEEIIKQFNDKRIKYIKRDQKGGVSSARNCGIDNSRGDYIAFLDADNEWMENKLEKQMFKFENVSDDVGLVYTHYLGIFLTSGEVICEFKGCYSGDVEADLAVGCFLGVCAVIIRRKCIEKVGYFDPDVDYNEDWDLWLRIAKYYKFDFIPEFLAKYYVHGNQLSCNLSPMVVAWENFLDKHKDMYEKMPSIYSMHLDYLGRISCFDDQFKKGRGYFLKSIKYKPVQKSGYLNLGLSFISSNLHKNYIDKTLFKKKNGIRLYK